MFDRLILSVTALAASLTFPGIGAASSAATAQTRTLSVGGISYAYREIGPSRPSDAPPIVLLQRFRGTLDDWDPAFLELLAKTRRLLVLSNAGVGSSTGTVSGSVADMAANAAGFIRATGHSRVDVFGWSMGGFVAQALALDHPDLVRKVVLVGTGPGGNPENAPPAAEVFGVAVRPTYGLEEQTYLFFAKGREAQARASMERIAARTSEREPAIPGPGIEAQAGAIQAFMGGQTGHFARLKDLRQPTLILSGDRDPFFPMKNVWLLHRELPNAELAVHPNSGHAPHHQHPVEAAAQIERFLAAR